MAEIDEATDRVLMGPAKKSKKYTDKENVLIVGEDIAEQKIYKLRMFFCI